jgi:hypothetical protein
MLAVGFGVTASMGGHAAHAALNGSLYAVVAPVFGGADGAQISYIRFWNGAAAPTVFSVTIVGNVTGNTYGTVNITVPRTASPQYPVTAGGGSNNIVAMAGAPPLSDGDTGYALYIQNSDPSAGIQHVTFNPTTTLFGNASSCVATLNAAIQSVANSLVLTNLHTTTLSGYPSQIYVHNFWNAAVTYKITVIEAATGAVKGQVQQAIGANSTYSVSMASLQNAVGWSPSSTEYHANLIISDATGGVPYATVSQQIVNNQLGGSIDMSMACAVNPPQTSANPAGGGLNGY